MFDKNWINRIVRGSTPVRGIVPSSAGKIQHYSIRNTQGSTRAHLRTDPDGSGVLIINANTIFHLNPTAARMAFLYLEGFSESDTQDILRREYRVSKDQIQKDLASFQASFQGLLDPDGGCPICDYEVETNRPFSQAPSAPYRMDLALTYRCNNECAHCYNEKPRQRAELSDSSWKMILAKLWEFGVPHIVFTGGEPTLRNDLPALIHHAESLGQITGVNTNGRRMKDPGFVSSLVDAGLDHAQITLESHIPQIHDRMVAGKGAWLETTEGIRNALSRKLFIMTNTTLLKENSIYLRDTLAFLGDLGVLTIGLNALIYSGSGKSVGTGLQEEELPELLDIAREITSKYRQRLIWYTPTRYCHFDPVQMQLGVKGCTAALYNMCIEPDGEVLPCQSYYSSLGNILSEPWDTIWNHPLALQLRNRSLVSTKCIGCSFLQECGGGCPLESDRREPEPERFIDFAIKPLEGENESQNPIMVR